jgi:hypothetical protein
LFFSEPAKIIETNLNVSRNIAAEAGTDLVMFCKSEGNPLPNITWFKVSRMLTKQQYQLNIFLPMHSGKFPQVNVKVKGKVYPRTGHEGPERE